LAAAAVSLVVLSPLALAKRRLGRRMNSKALRGDGTLSGIGAATSFLALAALVVYQLLGWWWADRITALIVAAVPGMANRARALRSAAHAGRAVPFLSRATARRSARRTGADPVDCVGAKSLSIWAAEGSRPQHG
jgi:hypothetical protein